MLYCFFLCTSNIRRNGLVHINLPETLHLTFGGFLTVAGQNIAFAAGSIEGEKSVEGSNSPNPPNLDSTAISSPRLSSEKLKKDLRLNVPLS